MTHGTTHWRGYIASDIRAEIANSQVCWTPKSATWFAESWDFGDALGGSAGNKFSQTTLRMQNSQNGTWVSPSLNAANACSIREPEAIFKCDITSSDAFQAWTDR